MYPVRFHLAQAPEERGRVSVGLRYLFALPWVIVAAIWGLGAYAATIVAWFSIVLGRGYPPALYEFNARYLRMSTRANAFMWLGTDVPPPFDGEPLDGYPVRVDIDPDSGIHDRLSVAIRALYLIPVSIVIWLVSLLVHAVAIVGWFLIVFTGRMSGDFEELIGKGLASITRATAYALLFTDRYPPVWDEDSVIGLPQAGQQPPAVPSATAAAL